MTRRERNLLSICFALLALTVLLRWLILPSFEEKTALETTLETMTLTRQSYTGRFRVLDDLDGALAAHREELRSAAAEYPPVLPPEEVDRRISALLLKHGLFPLTLSIGEGSIAAPKAYLSSEKPKKEKTYDGVTLEEVLKQQEPDPDRIAQKGKEGIVCTKLSFRAAGSRSQWIALLNDAAENYPYLRFTAFTLDGSEETVTVHASLELYMAEEGQG